MRAEEIELDVNNPDVGRVRLLRTGRVFVVSGIEIALFPIAVMAEAVERDTKTLRRWEKEGRWPKPLWKVPDKRCLRWYSRNQIVKAHELYRTFSRGEYGFGHSPHFDVIGFCNAIREMFYRVDCEAVEAARRAKSG